MTMTVDHPADPMKGSSLGTIKAHLREAHGVSVKGLGLPYGEVRWLHELQHRTYDGSRPCYCDECLVADDGRTYDEAHGA